MISDRSVVIAPSCSKPSLLSFGPRRGARGIQEYDMREEWVFDVFACDPQLDERYADEAQTDAGLWAATYHLSGVFCWEDDGIQCLHSVDRRPDRARPHQFNLDEVMPRISANMRPIAFGKPGDTQA